MAKKILFQIEVENVGAARRIEALREEIRRLNKEIRGVETGSEAFNELVAKLTDAKHETAKLKDEQKALNREFQAAKFPKDSLAGLRIEYAKLTDQIKVLSAAERASPFGRDLIANAANVKRSIDGIEQSLGRFTGNVGNYKSAFASLAQIVSGGLIGGGLVLTVNEIAQATARAISLNRELSDSIADVAKTTDLTDDELRGLIQTLEARGSRTSIFDQLNIAAIGGQLGVVDAQIKDFTAGVDVLNVALGDQFGSVDVLTREFAGLRNVLTDFRTDEIGDDILKLGNAVNFLEAQGNATGQTIVDFAGRIAGAGVPLGLTTDKIIGLSTTLAELAINPERGATAVNRLLQEVARTPELFAQAIGEPTAKFRKLVETDLLGAVALVSERISKGAASNVQFAQTLEALGIGSQGAIEVFGKLGGNIALLNTRITQSGEQLQGTGSIYAEFEKRNNNAEAAVSKLQNRLVALATSENAENIVKGVAEALTDLVDILSEAPELIEENKEELIALGLVLLSFNKTAQAATLATTALSTAQGRAAAVDRVKTVTQNLLNAATAEGGIVARAYSAALAATPLAAFAAALYIIVKAYESYQNEASAAEKATRAVADAQEDIAEQSAAEVLAVERNINVLKSATATRGEQKEAIEALVAINPEYLKGIDLEKASVSQLDEIQKGLTESIIKQVAARRKQVEQEKLVQQIIDDQLDIARFQRGESTFLERNPLGARRGFTEQQLIEGRQKAIVDAENQLDALDSKFAEVFGLESPKITRAAVRAKQFRLETGIESDFEDLIDDQASIFTAGLGLAKGVAAELGGELDKTGDEADKTGDKLKGVGDKSKGAKDGIDAQAGSVAALREEISKLEKQIQATAPDSPKLKTLGKQLRDLRKQLEAAERAIKAAELEPQITRPDEQPKIEFVPELQPGADEKLKADALLAARAVEDALKTIEFPVELIVKEPTQAELQVAQEFFDFQKRQGEEADEEAARREQKRIETAEAAKQAAFKVADATANAIFEIDRNRLEQQTQLAIDKLDIETQARIAAAKGNETKIAAIEKDAQKKREAIEKDAARQRKELAIKEALINTALAITKALTGAPPPANFILAGVSAAAGAAQIAVIRSQEFWEGGVVKANGLLELSKVYIKEFYKGGAVVPDDEEMAAKMKYLYLREYAFGGAVKQLKPGVVTEPQNAPRTAHGDTVLAYLAPGEMVLNRGQQDSIRAMFGKDAFALAGVPGESATRRAGVPQFATGGVVGIVPQNGFSQQISGQPVTVEVKSEFSQEHIDALGAQLGGIIGELVERGAFNGTLLGNDEANRMAERQAVLQQNREG